MDLSKMLKDTLLGSSSINTLSETSGANKNQVQQVLMDALPTLVQSMQKNASTKSGADSLSKALSDHAKDDTSNIGSFLKNVDLEDGAKILGHILGDKTKTVESGAAKRTGLTASQAGTILASAAPLLLNLLGQKKAEEDQKESGSGGLFSVLASALLGGLDDKVGSGGDGSGDNSLGEKLADGLGDVLASGLGSLLGGDSSKGKSKGRSKSSSSGGGLLGGLIGSLLGGVTSGTTATGSAKKQTTKKTTTKTAKKATTTKKTTTTATKTATTKTTTKPTGNKK